MNVYGRSNEVVKIHEPNTPFLSNENTSDPKIVPLSYMLDNILSIEFKMSLYEIQ